MKFDTKVVRAGITPDPTTGSIVPPIYQSPTQFLTRPMRRTVEGPTSHYEPTSPRSCHRGSRNGSTSRGKRPARTAKRSRRAYPRPPPCSTFRPDCRVSLIATCPPLVFPNAMSVIVLSMFTP